MIRLKTENGIIPNVYIARFKDVSGLYINGSLVKQDNEITLDDVQEYSQAIYVVDHYYNTSIKQFGPLPQSLDTLLEKDSVVVEPLNEATPE